MREISREEHEMILNLFLMEIAQSYDDVRYGIVSDYYAYLWFLTCSKEFKLIKDCFPMDEYHLPLMFSLLLGGNVNGNVVVNLNEV